METTPHPPLAFDEPPPTPPARPATAPAASQQGVPESRGCLYALSQPPLMVFLAVIAALLAITGVHDLLLL